MPYGACDTCAKLYPVDRGIDDGSDSRPARPACGQPLRNRLFSEVQRCLGESTPKANRPDEPPALGQALDPAALDRGERDTRHGRAMATAWGPCDSGEHL